MTSTAPSAGRALESARSALRATLGDRVRSAGPDRTEALAQDGTPLMEHASVMLMGGARRVLDVPTPARAVFNLPVPSRHPSSLLRQGLDALSRVRNDLERDTGDAWCAAQRTSVIVALDRSDRPRFFTWYLRLRSAAGRDPFFGLIRAETGVRVDDVATVEARADTISAWLLAERSPLAKPDARWDVMPYAIRDCEVYLRAVA